MKNNICEKCNEGQLITEAWAKKTAPNQYRLFSKIICKKCKVVKVEEQGEFDKNTDGTRKLLMDLKIGRVEKDHRRNKKSPVKEQEIDVMSLFPDEKK